MKSFLLLSLLFLLNFSAHASGREPKTCDVVDPVRVEFGGKHYAIPASYQPRFDLDGENKATFYIYEQHYYQDGKRLKNRYCRRKGQQKVDGFSFSLENADKRRKNALDVYDAIVIANSPAFDALDKVSIISIRNTQRSNEPALNDRMFKNSTLSESRLYLYMNSPDNLKNENKLCHSQLLSVNPTIFGGRATASCSNFMAGPSVFRWRVYVATDAFGQPHGSLMVDINQTKFEDWPPVLETVKKFLESMYLVKN